MKAEKMEEENLRINLQDFNYDHPYKFKNDLEKYLAGLPNIESCEKYLVTLKDFLFIKSRRKSNNIFLPNELTDAASKKRLREFELIIDNQINLYNELKVLKFKKAPKQKNKAQKISIEKRDYDEVEKLKKKYASKISEGKMTVNELYHQVSEKFNKSFESVKKNHTTIQKKNQKKLPKKLRNS